MLSVMHDRAREPAAWGKDLRSRRLELRLRQDELAALAGRGVAALPAELGAAGLDRWFPEYILVVEGQAKAAVPELPEGEGVRVVAAPGSGDDTIAELAATAPGRRLVVTADRELRHRSTDAGAAVTGPRWLLGQLSS